MYPAFLQWTSYYYKIFLNQALMLVFENYVNLRMGGVKGQINYLKALMDSCLLHFAIKLVLLMDAHRPKNLEGKRCNVMQ